MISNEWYMPSSSGKKWRILNKDASKLDADRPIVPFPKSVRIARRNKKRQKKVAALLKKNTGLGTLVDTVLPRRDTWLLAPNISHTEDFGQNNTYIRETPQEIDTFCKYISAGLPYVDSNHFFTQIQTESVTEEMIYNKKYSYPQIINVVRWCALFLSTERGTELIGASTYKNVWALEELIVFLDNITTTNPEETNQVKLTLMRAFIDLQ